MQCLNEVSDKSCETFKKLCLEDPSFDILYLFQDFFDKFRTIILSSTDNLNQKIDDAEILNSQLPGCQSGSLNQIVKILEISDNFITIFTRRMEQYITNYGFA